MKTVHAGLYSKVIREAKRAIPGIEINGLLSLPYLEGAAAEMVQLRQVGILDFLMLDTGTYGSNVVNNKPQQPSRFNEYAQYCKLFGHKYDLVPAYDEDFNDTDLNHMLLERFRLKMESARSGDAGTPDVVSRIMPVVHATKGALDEFTYYHDLGYGYIAMGSKPEVPKDEVQKIQAYRYAHNIKVHLFGKSSFDEITAFAPDSVDSSNFALTVFHDKALMQYWKTDGEGGPRLINVVHTEIVKSTDEVYSETRHGEYLRQAGFTFGLNELMTCLWKRHMVNIYSNWLFQKWMTDFWCVEHRKQFTTAA